MENKGMFQRAFVTGGAGFIGSHVVDRLVRDGSQAVVYDNFSTGRREYLQDHEAAAKIKVVEGDVLDRAKLHAAMRGCDAVFHFQAHADVREGLRDTSIDLTQNLLTTHAVLDGMREHGIKTIVFASSATVYGEPTAFPTPESYAPTQTSLYGASKLACEALIQAFGEYFGIRSFCFRFVSWIGTRYSHGVIFDFVRKLRRDPTRLEILGDGTQTKSYLDVTDGIAGIFRALESLETSKNVLNLGHDEFLTVRQMAAIILDEMGLADVHLDFTGGVRGWLGDSPLVHLDTSAMKAIGWGPRVPIDAGVRQTVRFLLENPWLIEQRHN
jgi:UDP-glucose 4-epimerase